MGDEQYAKLLDEYTKVAMALVLCLYALFFHTYLLHDFLFMDVH